MQMLDLSKTPNAMQKTRVEEKDFPDANTSLSKTPALCRKQGSGY